jgi:hypothetical protein
MIAGRISRLLKKTHLLRCARSSRSRYDKSTFALVDCSRASHLNLFERPASKRSWIVVVVGFVCR